MPILKLHLENPGKEFPKIVSVSTSSDIPVSSRGNKHLAVDSIQNMPEGFSGYIIGEQDNLCNGDILCFLDPDKAISLFQVNDDENTIFLTDRCNCNCICCPQPYFKHDQYDWFNIWKQAISHIPDSCKNIGISGGEPTLLRERLLDLLRELFKHLPSTSVNILSNGRMCNYVSFCTELRSANPNISLGIPLFSDIKEIHDNIVNVPGAFTQTVRGICNLARTDIPVELRVVLLKKNYQRLPEIAHFIARNFPFVYNIAFMGIELMGHARKNEEELWIEPQKIMPYLKDAVSLLNSRNVLVSIYNFPLCVLPESLHPFGRASISPWKRRYFEKCSECVKPSSCAGSFFSTWSKFKSEVVPIT